MSAQGEEQAQGGLTYRFPLLNAASFLRYFSDEKNRVCPNLTLRHDHMNARPTLILPMQFALEGKVLENPVRQILRRFVADAYAVSPAVVGSTPAHLLSRSDGGECTIVNQRVRDNECSTDLLQVEASYSLFDGPLRGKWLTPFPVDPVSLDLETSREACKRVLDSFQGQFSFREECREGDVVVERGLRPPQTGAIHAILAHWTVSRDLATVVMPTGTGKTETMLAVFSRERLPRLLVVVPTDALRKQVGDKFLTLGLLRELGVLGSDAGHPIVGLLEHRPRSTEEVDEFFLRCNVVVTTMAVAGRCSDTVKARMAEVCSHLFIDEAHHVPAPSWSAFRQHFVGKPVVQFTATPFRRDGKLVNGTVIFNYPLRKAQAEGYFKPIDFLAVDEIDVEEADTAIACVAVDRLEADLSKGYRHIVMARTDDVRRAGIVLETYRILAPQHGPEVLHSGMTKAAQQEVLRRVSKGEIRVIVCVDMLGEGYDMPELKIAAMHDTHKSLAVTLQFTGRFTRFRQDLGDATMVANVADPRVGDALRELYAEDADWNVILRTLSERGNERQARRSALLEGFGEVPAEVSLCNIFPKMSAVVYRTDCAAWRPDLFEDGLRSAGVHWGPTINEGAKLLLFITEEHDPVPWGDVKHLRNREWHLYAVHWDEGRNLLFINSSNNCSDHEDLAKAVGGGNALLIKGEQVFRSLHGINRIILTNLGLSDVINQNNRFSLHVGTDISDALPQAIRESKKKSNLFSNGYEGGNRVTVGCSQKGRIWSYKIAYDLSEWIDWCHHIGSKLVDETISTDQVFRGVILPRPVRDRPKMVPTVIEWPLEILSRSEDVLRIEIDGSEVPFYDAGIEILDFTETGPLRFRVTAGEKFVDYLVEFRDTSVEYRPVGRFDSHLLTNRRRGTLSEWFRRDSPVIRFANGAFLEHNELFELPPASERRPFDKSTIVAANWAGTDLKVESQTPSKRVDSIQRKVLESILASSHDPYFDIVFDDDGAGEAADIVCVRITGNRIVVHLYHCKFSKEATPGARVDDLYAVCGQAQRSIHWRGRVDELLLHLRRRDELRRSLAKRKGEQFVTRFERGDAAVVQSMLRRLPHLSPEFRIIVVQPGLSKGMTTTSQLELLGVTETYLKETYGIALGVIASS